MSWSIDNVDADAIPHHGDVLRQNCDPAFALEIVGVQNTGSHPLILAEHSALLNQAVHQRCFAVVNVGDNGNVANISTAQNASAVDN